MSNENQGKEYIKVVQDIIEHELNLAPANPSSTDPNEHRVFIYNQDFVLPTYKRMLVVLSPMPAATISNRSTMDDSTPPNEVAEILMQQAINIDVMSRDTEARQRKEEILMALASFYSQRQQGANGFRIFTQSTSFTDISEAEGSGMINRYRVTIMCHVHYIKTKAADYYGSFTQEIHED